MKRRDLIRYLRQQGCEQYAKRTAFVVAQSSPQSSFFCAPAYGGERYPGTENLQRFGRATAEMSGQL